MQAKEERITLAHGSGGSKTRELVEVFKELLGNPILNRLDDSAVLELEGAARGKIAFTTDSFVVNPIFFPGGDIGKLSITGTINDLASLGALPKYISAAFIIEEGFSLEELKRIVASMAEEARRCQVEVVAGDTKVVGLSQADKIYINTAGIGIIPEGIEVGAHLAKPGDLIILTGTLGDHSIAIASAREDFMLKTNIKSDCQALHRLTQKALKVGGTGIHTLRDVTRGGLASVLNEIAKSSGVQILIYEDAIPVEDAVAGACAILGFDVLHLPNEGKMVIFAEKSVAQRVTKEIRKTPEGRNAQIIGKVLEQEEAERIGMGVQRNTLPVAMLTSARGLRAVEPLAGEILPRIC